MSDSFRSAALEDFPIEDLRLFRPYVDDVADPALRARLGDVLWVKTRDHQAAATATEAYLKLAAPLTADVERWPALVIPLERALQLSTQLRGHDVQERVRSFLDTVTRAQAAGEDGFLSKELINLALDYRVGDPETWYALAREIALGREAVGDWIRAETYWETTADCAARARNVEGRREALRHVAEAHVRQAGAVRELPHVGGLRAAHHYDRAIEALRRSGGERERIDEIHREMVGVQRDSPPPVIPYGSTIDISALVEVATGAVTGKELGDALLSFALLPCMDKVANLRRQAEIATERYVFKHLFPAVQLDAQGKVVRAQGSLTSDDPAEREAALRAEMLMKARQHQNLYVQGMIDHAWLTLQDEHAIRSSDLLGFLLNHPLVPAGREMLWAEGLYAGFHGDFSHATHVLVNQLEHAVRELLGRAGAIVTIIDRMGMQADKNLNQLLYDEKLKEILGDDLVFTLQGVLVEDFGSNLRNRVDHGKMDYAEFFQTDCRYLWWLCLRLVWLPIARIRQVDGAENEGESETGSDSR